MGNSGELPAKSHEVASTTENQASGGNLLEDFGRSVAYSAVEAPVLGLTQIFDSVAGTHFASDLPFSAPTAKFGSVAWHADQIGSALGMLVPFIGVSKGIKGVEGLFGAGGDAAAELTGANFLTRPGLLGVSTREAALTGFTMNAFLQPSQNTHGGLASFALTRLENGGIGAATFASMSMAGMGLKRLGGSTIIGSDIGAGVLSGIPGGAVSSELSALQSGHALPTGKDLGQSVYSFAMVGGLFGAGHFLKASAVDGSRATNYEALKNRLQFKVDGVKQAGATTAERLANALVPRGGSPAFALAGAADGFGGRGAYDFASRWTMPTESRMQMHESTSSSPRSFAPGDSAASADASSRPPLMTDQARERIAKFAQLEPKINAADDHQAYIQKYMKGQLSELKQRGMIGKEWFVFPTQAGSPADMIGGDFLLMNARTGEYHLLDATSNSEKAANPGAHNVANIRQNGLIYYDKPIFDEIGKLRTDSSEPPNISNAVATFREDIDSQLISLTHTRSPLNMMEVPLPSITAQDAAKATEQIDAYSQRLSQKAAATADPTIKGDLEDFARRVKSGTSTYLDKTQRTLSSVEFHDTVGQYADRAIVNFAIAHLLGRDFIPSDPKKALSQASYHAKGESLKLEVNGTIYDSGNITRILSESRGRVLQSLPDLLTESQLKSLRKAMPSATDSQIESAVSRQVADLANVIRAGGKLGNGRPVLIDYIVGRLRGTAPEVNLGEVKPEEPPAPAEKATAQPQLSEIDKVLADQFATIWKDQNLPKLQAGQVPDTDYVELVFDEMKNAQPQPLQSMCDAMLTKYKANDPATIRAITDALSS